MIECAFVSELNKSNNESKSCNKKGQWKMPTIISFVESDEYEEILKLEK